jgi:hypothetical protein
MKRFSDFLEGRCWTGFKPVPGKKPYSPGSCVKESAAAAIAAATAIAKKKLGNYDEKGFRKTPYKNPDHPNRKSNTEREAELKEDLRKWFSKTDPAGGWKRINSKGEAIGPCAREPGEPKPKCMSNEKRASLTKKERASAVASKRRNDPNPERQGKPINVSNFGKGKISEDMENLDEKNVPTSPEKWAQAKSQAKAKFDVYPSAYANGWASKKYKEMGGGWKSVSEENEVTEGAVPAKEKIITVKHKTSGKTLRISAAAAAKYRMQGYHYHPVNEAKDEQEYGYEGDMALNQLATLIRCGEMIKDLLKPNTDMPEWVQSKITLATDYIQTAADYMYSEMKEEVEPIEELSNATLRGYADKARTDIQKTLPKLHTDAKAAGRIDKRVSGLAASTIAKVKNNMKKEEVEQIDEVSLKTASSAYAKRIGQNEPSSQSKAVQTIRQIAKKHGASGVATAAKTAEKEALKKVQQEDVEQVDEISQDLAGRYLEKVTHDQLKKSGMHHNLYGQLPPKRQAGVGRALDRLVVNKESVDSNGGPPTEAAATLTVTGQPKLNKTVGQTKMIPYVQEDAEADKKSGSWKVETPWRKVKGTGTVTDKSGAKHTPMSRARDLARQAIKKKMEEQSNVKPNPFTVPEIPIGKADKPKSDYVKARDAGSSTKNAQARAAGASNAHMFESRQLEIVREAMKVAKKKKEVTEAGSDKFIADPELTSQITKSNP